VSTNDLERSRRDVDAQVFEYDHISPDSNAHLAWPLNSLSNPPAVTKKHSNLGNFKFAKAKN
jgi:hypothetical protein